MALFLNIAGSVCMVAFLFCLVWRGLWELGWLPKVLACPFAQAASLQAKSAEKEPAGQAVPSAPLQPKSAAKKTTVQSVAKERTAQSIAPCSKREGIVWFAAALALSWFFIWVGFRYSGQQNFYSFLPYAWQRFTTAGDAPHYQYLAEEWYATAGDSINLIVFYPLYPLLVKIGSLLTLGNALAAGVVLSNLCWGLAAAAMRRLAGRFYGAMAARCATLSMLLFPFSFFAIGMFTESLFLLLTILTLDAIATKRFTVAGLLGCLAALCRTQGVVLILAAVYAFLRAYRGKQVQKEWRKALSLALIPFGYLIYLGLNWLYCGEPLAFLYYQSIAPWYQQADWIGNNLAQQWGMAMGYPGLAPYIYFPQLVLYFIAMALLIYGVLAKVPIPWLLYGGAYIGASYLSNWLISGSRYVFGCAVVYLVIAHIKNTRVQIAIFAAEVVFLLYYATCFMQGQSIM